MSASMSRLLWIEFRRNVGIWFIIPTLFVAWYLLDRNLVWIPFLWSSTNHLVQKTLILFAGPAIAGAAAWMAGRDRRRGIDDLLETTPMPIFSRRLTLLVSTALWAALTFIIFAAFMLGRTALLATWGRPALWPILIVLAALAAQAAWGFLAGSIVSSRFTAPLAAIAAFAVELSFETTSSATSVTTGGAAHAAHPSNWLSDLTPDNLSPFPHWQFLFYVGLTATALAALLLIRRVDLVRIGLLLVSIVITGASVVMTWGDVPRYDPTSSVLHNGWGQMVRISAPVQPNPVCAGQPVTVCTNLAWQPVLGKAVTQANDVVQPLLGLPSVPMRVDSNETGLESPRGGETYLDISHYVDRLVATDQSMPNGYVQNEAQIAIRNWLLQRVDIEQGPSCDHTQDATPQISGAPTAASCAAAGRFAQLSASAQRNWLEAHYADLRAGKLSLADLP